MIGKCNTGGGENLTTQLNNQDAIITELESKVQSVSGVDMATPVNAQTVTIEQIQESLVDKGAVNKVELIVTPEKDNQEYTPDYGTLYSKVTVNGDADLIAENIRDGVNVFGVEGTCPPPYGLNVWAKKEYLPEVTITNPTMTLKSGGPNYKYIDILDENFDLNRVADVGDWRDFFDGFVTDSSSYYLEKVNRTFYIHWRDYSVDTTSFNPLNKKFNISSALSSNAQNITMTGFVFKGTKTFPETGGETVGFVVNNNPNAYPNGAVHTDGYYYELLGQVTSANVMSLSDNALETVQQDYRDTIVQEVTQ